MSQLTLYNSLTRTKAVFTPIDPKRVTMYNCGPTVYSYAHIGNARAAVVADVLFRVLRHIYGVDHVEYARNITDVDDKIIASAKELGVPISEITEKYAKIYNDDLRALGCLAPTHQPKATEHIEGMVEMIGTLIDEGYAYASDGHVFFDVSTYADYGKLSGNTMDQLKKGGRVGEGEVARKRNSADFVLWKPPLDGVGWPAPFGANNTNMEGRPGWHIECSAMSKSSLRAETIDIHCGGVDLKFPHHENEIAQSACAHGGKPMANYWVHNEFLNMGSEKMSKSLGNVTLISDLLKDWDGEVIRLALLKAHYRSELAWSEGLLAESQENLDGWYRILLEAKDLEITPWSETPKGAHLVLIDDLAVSAHLMALKAELSSLKSMGLNMKADLANRQSPYLGLVRARANLLGLLQKDPEEWFRGNTSDDDEAKINDLIAQRDAAKAAALAAKAAGDKAEMGAQFKRSDEIRDQIKAMGIVLEDGADGTRWRRA